MNVTRRRTSMLAAAVVAVTATAPAAAQTAPRPNQRVEARHGVVTAAHPAAAAAGLEMLRAGGNAVDAAVAAAFAIGVVEPMMSGVGAGGAMTIWLQAPGEAWHDEFYASAGADPDSGLGSVDVDPDAVSPERWVAVPGAVAGLLESLGRYGRLDRARVLAPAIRLARDGFTVHSLLAQVVDEKRDKLLRDSAAAALFYPNGERLRAGDRLVQLQLAVTLERIAREGRDAIYRGPFAAELIRTLRAGGNPLTLDDLARYEPRWRRPLCGTYRGDVVLAAPPPLAGVEVIEALDLLEPLSLAGRGYPEEDPAVLGRMVDAIRIARADYYRWIGDPRDVGVPAAGIATHAYAAERARWIGADPVPDTLPPGDPWEEDRDAPDSGCAGLAVYPPSHLAPPGDEPVEPGTDQDDAQTTQISVVDADGNAVSLTYTLGLYFGSGTFVGGAFFNTAAGNFGEAPANARGPYRVPRSSTAPTIVLRNGRVKLVVGSPASGRISSAIVHTIVYTLDYGLDPWTAVAEPRVYPAIDSPEVEIELGFTSDALAALRTRGYVPDVHPPFDLYFGGVNAVFVRDDGVLVGASDPRRDGAAVGY